MVDLALAMAGNNAAAEQPLEDAGLAAILKLAKSGDVAAFEQILARHERRVFLTALRMLGRVEDAQDAAQEVFLRLHRHLRRFDETRQFEPWLYRVTVNVCRDIEGKRRARAELPLDEETTPADAGAEVDVRLEEQRGILKRGLRTLPAKERAALVLRDLEGLPTREVARILGSTEATVRSQISSARLKMKLFAERFLRRGQ